MLALILKMYRFVHLRSLSFFILRKKKKSDMTGFVLLSQRWAGAPFWGKEET